MNGMVNGIPWLTIITVLPVVGAAIALVFRQACARRGSGNRHHRFCSLYRDLVAPACGWIDRHGGVESVGAIAGD